MLHVQQSLHKEIPSVALGSSLKSVLLKRGSVFVKFVIIIIPVIIGATGSIPKSFRKYVSYIPGKHEVKELQKTAILGTAHILRKVLM